MKKLQNLLLGISGIISILPVILILKDARFIPPFSNSSIYYLIIIEFISVTVFLILLLNENKIKRKSIKYVTRLGIVLSALLLFAFFIYILLFKNLVITDSYGRTMFPILSKGELKEKIEFYGGRENFILETDTVTADECIKKMPHSQSYLSITFILFLVLYLIISSLLCIIIGLLGFRINAP